MASGNHPRDATAKYAKYAKGSIGPSLVVFRVVRVFRGHVLLFSAPSVVHSEGLDEVSFAPTSRRGRRRGQPRLFYRRLPRPVCCLNTKNHAGISKAGRRRQAVDRRGGRRRQTGIWELRKDHVGLTAESLPRAELALDLIGGGGCRGGREEIINYQWKTRDGMVRRIWLDYGWLTEAPRG
jgi:hypothetical protein